MERRQCAKTHDGSSQQHAKLMHNSASSGNRESLLGWSARLGHQWARRGGGPHSLFVRRHSVISAHYYCRVSADPEREHLHGDGGKQ
eukprot:2126902-Pyramimonas_sp.AAC.2